MTVPSGLVKIKENEVLKYHPVTKIPKVIDASLVYQDPHTQENVTSEPLIVKREKVTIGNSHDLNLLLDIYGDNAFEIIALRHPEIRAARRIQHHKEIAGKEGDSFYKNITTVFAYQTAGVSEENIYFDFFYPKINGKSYYDIPIGEECFDIHLQRMNKFAEVLDRTHNTGTAHKDVALRNLIVPDDAPGDIVLVDFGAAILDDNRSILSDICNYIVIIQAITANVYNQQKDERAFIAAVQAYHARNDLKDAYKKGTVLTASEIAFNIFQGI